MGSRTQKRLSLSRVATAFVLPSLMLLSSCSGEFFRGPNDLIAFAITPLNASVQAGGVQQYTSSGVYGDYATGDVTSKTTWTSSNSNIATMNASGLATGVAGGSVTITGKCQSYTINTVLTISTATKTLSSIAITPLAPSISVGSTQQFTATGTYSDGTTAVLTNGATWASSNVSVATINSTGLASAVSAGSTAVTASFGTVTGRAALTAQ